MIALSFLTFIFGVGVGIAAAVMLHNHSHPDCPANKEDR